MNRRDFTKLSTLTAASLRLPHALAQNAAPLQKPIGFAAVGIGGISTAFMDSVASSKTVKITALVTGHPDTKGVQFSQMYGLPKSSVYTYETFDKIRDNPEIDAIYIGLPNSMHCEYTVRGAQAGKHVLCEKPMAISSAECVQMIDACKAAHVKLMIAYRLHFEPTTLKALDIVRSGKLGGLQAMEGANGFNIKLGEWRYTKALGGGGSLFDMGIYCLNAFRTFSGEEPIDYQAQASTRDRDDERFKEVEENVSWLMKFPSGITVTGASSYGANMPGFYRIHGPSGWLQVGTFTYQGQHLMGQYAAAEKGAPPVILDEISQEKDPMQFVRQVDHFSDCILHDRTPQPPGEEGLADIRGIEAIYKAAGVKL